MHDWWIYQIITGVGGTVIHDDEPGVLYRQHGGNEIGAHHGIQASISRVTQALRGRFQRWNDINVVPLSQIAPQLTPEHRRVFESFARDRRGPLPHRLRALWRSGVYRQSKLGGAALWLSAVLGRL